MLSVLAAVLSHAWEAGFLGIPDIQWRASADLQHLYFAVGRLYFSYRRMVRFPEKSATTVIISALILTAPMTNFASAGMYGWMSLAGFAAVMGALYFIVYRSLSRKVSLMEVL